MKRWAIAGLALAIGSGVAFADGLQAIKDRQALMKANGEASKPLVPMLKGGPFDLAVVQKALKTYINAANKMPGLFPPDSKTGDDTHALPAIWENKADVDARFKKLGEDATAALSEVKDEASFKAVMTGVFKNCGGCHDKYRAKLKE
jgi:cytochrome c556